MGKRKLRSVGLSRCCYCGRIAPTTRDHIPPKSFFATKPDNLITVPSCWDCNNAASHDDEIARTIIMLREEVAAHPEVERLQPKMIRGLQRPERREFKLQLLTAMFAVERPKADGSGMETATGIEVDLAPLERVGSRIVAGLLYHEKKQPLPHGWTASALACSGLPLADDGGLPGALREPFEIILRQPLHSFGENVFDYRVAFAEDNPNAGFFVLTFYRKVAMIGITAPDESIEENVPGSSRPYAHIGMSE